MANINVTYEDLAQAAVQLTNGQTEIENNLAALQSLVRELVSGGFVTDGASKQFESSYEEFNTGATQTIDGLTGMASYLKTASQTFSDVDSQLASALNK
jgi:WXG100 family type VII secretion target